MNFKDAMASADQWRRICQHSEHVNILAHDENGFWWNSNKVCRTSWKTAQFYEYPSTPLQACEQCGRLGSPKTVNCKSGCYSQTYRIFGPTLCMRCWNFIQRIVTADWALNELTKLANKLRVTKPL